LSAIKNLDDDLTSLVQTGAYDGFRLAPPRAARGGSRVCDMPMCKPALSSLCWHAACPEYTRCIHGMRHASKERRVRAPCVFRACGMPAERGECGLQWHVAHPESTPSGYKHAPYLIKIWSLDHGPRAHSSHIYVEADMFSAIAFAHIPPFAPRPTLFCEI
jgi:hypothetical protein